MVDKKIDFYALVTTIGSVEEFNDKILIMMNEDEWQPYGPPFMDGENFCQAMVIYAED